MGSAGQIGERTYTRFQYFTPADAERSDDFELTTLGLVDVPAGAVYPPSGHPEGYAYQWRDGRKLAEYQVHFIARGLGSFHTDVKGGSEHHILPGSTFVLFPEVWHRYAPVTDTGWREFWIGLRGRRVEELFRSCSLDERDPLPRLGNVQQVSTHFARAVSTLASHDAMSSEVRRALATLIVAELNFAPSSNSPAAPSVVERAVQLLHATSTTAFTLEELAERLNIGYQTLRHRFKKETGCTMHRMREMLRLKHATMLLRQPQPSVKEIAARCGFSDPYYFSRAFRRHFGVSPTQYRRKVFSRQLMS